MLICIRLMLLHLHTVPDVSEAGRNMKHRLPLIDKQVVHHS